jgi:hypothetical protein
MTKDVKPVYSIKDRPKSHKGANVGLQGQVREYTVLGAYEIKLLSILHVESVDLACGDIGAPLPHLRTKQFCKNMK